MNPRSAGRGQADESLCRDLDGPDAAKFGIYRLMYMSTSLAILTRSRQRRAFCDYPKPQQFRWGFFRLWRKKPMAMHFNPDRNRTYVGFHLPADQLAALD